MSAAPLTGRGIAVTRPAAQAEELAALIEAAGGRALRFPAIDIHDVDWTPPALEGIDLVVFVSPTAVRKLTEKLPAWPAGLRAAAVGRGTRRELERLGAADVLAPEEGADSEALLALPEMQDVAGKRIVIVRGEGGREHLAQTLATRGAEVQHVVCYRRERPEGGAEALAGALERREVDAVTLTSAEGLDNLLASLDEAARERLLATPIFATHARIAEHARNLGAASVRLAGPGDRELVDALVAYFAPAMDQSPAPQSPPARRSRAPLLLGLLIVLAAAAAAYFWLDARNRIDATQAELARRLRDIEARASEARTVAREAQAALAQAQAKVGQLEARLAESESQQVALEALYQDLSRNRDEWQLAEIEQVLTIASQQLQLAGNVRAALLGLQLAESRLARAEGAPLVAIRQAIERDIERLKSLPRVDTPGMSVRIDRLVAQVERLPLAFEQRAEPAGAPKAPPGPQEEPSFWARLGAEVWRELRGLIVVRQVANPQPPLLPPAQAYFLRENLRLRLLNARLMLLAHHESGFREDLRQAEAWIRRYFDPQAKETAQALAEIGQLAAATLSFEMPTISESLEAVRAYQARRERTP